MMDKELLNKLNAQIANEMGSAVLYKNMQYYFDGIGMKNTADYYGKQAEGEYSHANGIAKFISDRKEEVSVSVRTFPIEDKTCLDILSQTLTHEQFVTKSLYDIYEFACQVEDPLTKTFIHDYLKEQIEEEAISQTILDTFYLTTDKLLFDMRIKEII